MPYFSTASVAEEVLELGAARYLSKGADVDEINDTIEEVAAQTAKGSEVVPTA